MPPDDRTPLATVPAKPPTCSPDPELPATLVPPAPPTAPPPGVRRLLCPHPTATNVATTSAERVARWRMIAIRVDEKLRVLDAALCVSPGTTQRCYHAAGSKPVPTASQDVKGG